ncbi:hypothetical protein BHM03_00063072, partial [Ensete ventricosum]
VQASTGIIQIVIPLVPQMCLIPQLALSTPPPQASLSVLDPLQVPPTPQMVPQAPLGLQPPNGPSEGCVSQVGSRHQPFSCSLSMGTRKLVRTIRVAPSWTPCRQTPRTCFGPNDAIFFWSLIERPPVTVLEMLQRANQFTTVETLVARKRKDHKKPCVKKSRGQPPEAMRRRSDRPEPSYPRPLPPLLNSTRTKIFLLIKEELLRTPNPLKEELYRRGYLRRYVRRSRDLSLLPQGPIEKQIDVIVEGLASEGDNSWGRKAYAQVGNILAKPMNPISPSRQERLNTSTMTTRW